MVSQTLPSLPAAAALSGAELFYSVQAGGNVQVTGNQLANFIASGSSAITSLTGDVTAVGPGAAVATLAAIIVAGGPTGSATTTPIITWDAKGRITAVTSATITPAASSITGGAALTKVNDTNITLTLGGTPASALLAATSITAGWTGLLGVGRGGTGTGTAFTQGSIIFAGASGVYSQDNAKFFWDDASGVLSIGANDVGLARNAARVLEVNNGSSGNFGDLVVRQLHAVSFGFSVAGILIDSSNDITAQANSSSTSATALILNNTSTGGHNFQFFSTGQANNPGFCGVFDSTSGKLPFAIDGTTTNVQLANTGALAWSTGTSANTTSIDTSLARTSAGGITLTGPANAALITSSGYSLTGTNAQSLFDLSGTWNTSGTPTAFKLVMTDTASNAASLLIDLQTGAGTQFHVDKFGAGFLHQSLSIDPLTGSANAYLYLNGRSAGTLNQAAIFADQLGDIHLSPGSNGLLYLTGVNQLTVDKGSGSSSATLNLTSRNGGAASPTASVFTDQLGGFNLSAGTGGIAVNQYLTLGAAAISADTSLWRSAAGVVNISTGGGSGVGGSLKLTDVFTNNATFFHRTGTALTNNAAAQIATITNGPTAGNPTKWIAIDDNGTTRYIPSW